MAWKLRERGVLLLIVIICDFRTERVNGQLCQEDNSPCQNGGTCHEFEEFIFCFCEGTGFFGPRCEDSVSGCPEDQPPEQCFPDPCDSATCPGNLNATCRANYCGGCNAEFYDSDGNVVDCSCPSNELPVTCQVNPCNIATCLSLPVAECRSNGCGECNALFYIGDFELSSCRQRFCPLESLEFTCTVDPCKDLTCPLDPSATCVPNNCGGCSPRFYNVVGEKINCGSTVCSEVECLSDPCVSASCPAYPSARCQASSCGACTAVFYNENDQMVDCDLDSCDPNPCQNGAFCIAGSGSLFGCVCSPGYMGQLCDVLDPCVLSPCRNGGTCVSAVNPSENFSCSCPPQYMGTTCEIANLCVPSPCLNGGTCTPDQSGIPRCTCLEDFTDPLCQTRVMNPCDPNPCFNGGQCTVNGGNVLCICDIAYTGTMCESIFDACAEASVCQNGGTCVSTSGIASCQCPTGYIGGLCEERVDPCTPNPCDNDGICIDLSTGIFCACLMGYTGSRCQTVTSICDNLPCRNGGTCEEISVNGVRTFSCECPQGYTGGTCEEIDDDPCSPANNRCVNGSCFPVPNTSVAVCLCLPGYVGVRCDTILNPCLSVNCLSGGQCVAVDNVRAVCVCTEDFTGTSCETPVSPCQVNPCFNQGVCLPDATLPSGYFCVCPDRFEGDQCQSAVTIPCFPDPCQNGFCIISNSDTTVSICLCDSGFTGEFCDQPFDPCASSPCQNSGSCLTNNGRFICNCTEGFMGERCENRVRCQPNPCFNGGTCQSQGTDSFRCECPRGYEGSRCEIMTDPCSDNACVNGECVPFQHAYTCVCNEGYSGLTCNESMTCDLSCPDNIFQRSNPTQSFYQVFWEQPEKVCGYQVESTRHSGGFFMRGTTPIQVSYLDPSGNLVDQCMFSITIGDDVYESPCDPSPCQNSGTCIVLQADIYVCLCTSGYTNINCATPIPTSSCASDPCENNGVCIEASGTAMGYMCACLQGYLGARCEIPDNACAIGPCQNGATCVATQDDSYLCMCTTGFTGTNCGVPLACFSGPCQNDGFCQEGENGGYICSCLGGFTGINCEQEDECFPNPCNNGATCFDLPGDYFCSCPTGFSGRRCEMNDSECILECPDNIVRIVNPSVTFERVIWEYEPFVCNLPVMFTFLPGSFFGIGDTIVQSTLQDSDGMTVRECTFTVSILPDGPCATSPCANGGMCTPVGSEFICQCSMGYMGLRCEEPITPEMRPLCAQEPCQNGGSCFGTEEFYFCFCAEGYSGVNCTEQEQQGFCDINPCQNGGTCVDLLTAGGTYLCLCLEGFVGDDCEEGREMDITPPRLDFCPILEEQYTPVEHGGAFVFWDEPRATDNSGRTNVTFQSHRPGMFFPLGVTVVQYDIEDPSGNSVSCFFIVLVTAEMRPPTCVPECPADINVVTDDTVGFTSVYWNMMSTMCNYMVLSSHVSGSIFFVGSETVTLIFQDGIEVVSSCDFTITVTQGFRTFCSMNPCQHLGTCQDLTDRYQCICPANFEGQHCEILTGVDEINPVVSFCPMDVLVQTAGGASVAEATWRTPQAVDNSGTVVVTMASSSPGDVFQLGVTTVLYEFCDPSGNKAMCQFRVIVEDPNECRIRCQDNIEKFAETGVQFIQVSWEQPETMCNAMMVSSPLPGSLFPVGNTLVTSMLLDSVGVVVDECQFMVAITPADQGNPCDDPTICGTGECILDSTQLNGYRCECTRCFGGEYCQIALPLANPCVSVTEALCQNGGTCSFTDCDFQCTCPDGYTGAYCEFEIFEFDSVPPTIIGCPVDIFRTVGAHETSAVVEWDRIRIRDESGTAFLVQSSHDSGDEFPLGITHVSVIYSDASQNRAYCQFSVTIQQVGAMCDTNACPEDILQFNTGDVNYMEVFWEQIDVVCGLVVQSSPQSGNLFPIGVTPVTWNMFDSNGAIRSACTFDVEVTDDFTDPCFQNLCNQDSRCIPNPTRPEGYQCVCIRQGGNCVDFDPSFDGTDTQPPTIMGCQDRSAFVELGMTELNYTWVEPTAVDNTGAVFSNSTHQPPFVFSLGVTVINYTFWDSSENIAQCSFELTLTAVDNTPPEIFSCTEEDIEVTASSTQKYVQVSYTIPIATDPSGVTTEITGQANGTFFTTLKSVHKVIYEFIDQSEKKNSATCVITIVIN